MHRKYFFISLIICILFIIVRVYMHSEYIKASYCYQTLTTQKTCLEKNLLTLQHNLQTFKSCGYSKKIATDILGFVPLTLKQVYSLPTSESTNNG